MSDRPVLIIVQGGPATGKTTLARRLAADLGIGLLEKDSLKEFLFDHVGIPRSRDESRAYGVVVMNSLMRHILPDMLKLKGRLIVEGAFHSQLANRDLAQLRSAGVYMIELFLYARHTVIAERWRQRIVAGQRHPGHLSRVDHVLDHDKYETLYAKLDTDMTIDIDTTDFTEDDYAKLLASLKERIGD